MMMYKHYNFWHMETDSKIFTLNSLVFWLYFAIISLLNKCVCNRAILHKPENGESFRRILSRQKNVVRNCSLVVDEIWQINKWNGLTRSVSYVIVSKVQFSFMLRTDFEKRGILIKLPYAAGDMFFWQIVAHSSIRSTDNHDWSNTEYSLLND